MRTSSVEACAPRMTAAHSNASESPISAVLAPAARTVCRARPGPPGWDRW
ncbi:hypothetical protein [Sphaerisporangium fuscum]|nr:hypothetical protein [Sphaerisporangium fuscum]